MSTVEYITETYAEAVAIATALSATGDEIEAHAADCKIDAAGAR